MPRKKVTLKITNNTNTPHVIEAEDRSFSRQIPPDQTSKLHFTDSEFEKLVPCIIRTVNVKERGEYVYDVEVSGYEE